MRLIFEEVPKGISYLSGDNGLLCPQELHAVWHYYTPPRRVPCVHSRYLGHGEEQLHLVPVLEKVLHQLHSSNIAQDEKDLGSNCSAWLSAKVYH